MGNPQDAAKSAKRGRSLIRQGSTLSLLTLASRTLGLIREMAKASLLGTSPLSDAFSVAFMIPNLFRRLFAEGSIAVAFIPTFKEYLLRQATEESSEEIRDFLSSMLTFLTFFVSLAVCVGILVAPWVVRIFGMEEYQETVFLTRVMFPYLGFISLAALFQGILNSLHIFAPSGMAPIVLNSVMILCAYALKDHTANPARALAIGVLLGGFLEGALQLPFLIHRVPRFFYTSLRKAIANPGTRQVLRLIGPTIFGMAAYQLNDLVSTALAGNAGAGVVSSLQYSLRIQELILGIFAVSLGTVLLPDLAESAKLGQWESYNDQLLSAIRIIAFITIPITFYSLLQGQTIIRLLFQAQSFDDDSVALTYRAFRFHIVGLYFIALNRILAPAFYAQSDSKSPTVAGIISFGLNMLLALVLSPRMKGGGIALALTLSSAGNTVLLLWFLGRNQNINVGMVLKPALAYTAKLALVSILAALPLLLLNPYLSAFFGGRGRLISFGLPLCISAALYGALGILLLLLTGDQQVRQIFNKFVGRRKQH